MHYMKTVNIVVIFATFRLVTFSRLVTHFCCGHNVLDSREVTVNETNELIR